MWSPIPSGMTLGGLARRLALVPMVWAGLAAGLPSHATTPPNTPIVNVATATYTLEGKTLSVSATSAVNTSAHTPSTISLFGVVPQNQSSGSLVTVNPGACLLGAGSNNWQPQQTFKSAFAGAISLPSSLRLEPSNTFIGRDVVMIAVNDPDQNRDPLVVERLTVEVSSSLDRETLQLAETGPGSGTFIGWILLTRQGSGAGDCRLGVAANETIRASYTDVNDREDSTLASGLVDPFGLVFNSLTGEPVNGARVSLINEQTGQAAAVYGDDGLARYPSMVVSGQNVTDSSGLLYPVEAGRYRFPLVVPGVYRLDVQPPEGFSFPSKVPETSVRKVLGDGYFNALGSKGEAFTVPMGPPSRLDVPLDPRTGRLLLSKSVNKNQAGMGDLLRYELSLRNADQVLVPGIEIRDVLPRGLRFRAGSARDGMGRLLTVRTDSDGRTLHIALGDLAGASSATVSYVVEVGAATPLAAAVNEAVATGTGASSNVATATVNIIDDMMASNAILVGTVFEGGCPRENKGTAQKGVPNARVILQDGRYAMTDAEGKWHIEGVRPGTSMVRLDALSLPKGQAVLSCTPDPRRSAGHSAKLLDVRPGSLNRVDFYTLGPRLESPKPAVRAPSANEQVSEVLARAEQAAIRRNDPAPAWAYPAEGYVPPQGFQSLMISHAPGERVVLEHQGEPVPGFHYEGTRVGAGSIVATSLWRNVHLKNGENRFVARVYNRENKQIAELERVLNLATAPVRAELVSGNARLLANGRDNPVILVRLLDARDQPVRPDITGEFSLGSPYVLKEAADSLAKNPLASVLLAAPRYVVGKDGIAAIVLAPTTHSGEVELSFSFGSGRTQVLRAWLQADQREWIVVGFAEGSPLGQKLRDTLQGVSGMTADAAEIRGQRLALYAKGTIPGNALLTLAYDSAKPPSTVGSSPQGIPVAPFYTVYSDQSQGGMETASWGKLYLKIEKSTFMAMLGNASTGLTQSELGRYVRSMYGLKSTWQGGKLSYTAFAMRNLTSFHRDVLRADGTSGSWQLSSRSIIPQTDKVRVLVRDRLDAGNILSERILSRMVDYTLDYVSGQFLLAQPVASFDATLNPVTIEVEYSTENTGADSHTVGARVAYKITPAVDAGLTMIQDSDAARGGRLVSTDVRAKLGPHTEVRLEAGTSSRRESGFTLKGNAVLAELRHDRPDVSARVYFRRADAAYGLNEQPVSTADMQSLGADLRVRLSEAWRVDMQASHQERLSTGQTADIVQTRANYSFKSWQASLGVRMGQENDGHGQMSSVAQLLTGIGYLSPDQKWSLRAAAELGRSHGGAIFPNRFNLEGDYRLTPRLSATAGQSWTFGDTHTSALMAGLKYQPWTGAEVQTGLSHRTWEGGENTAARMSLLQTSKLDSAWTLNAQLTSARRIAGNPFVSATNVVNVGAGAIQGATPPAGSTAAGATTSVSLDDFTTAGMTLSYSKEPWSGFARLEKRWADDKRHALAGGVSRKFGDGEHVLATARFEIFAGDTKPSTMISVAHASRQQSSPWTRLHRLDWLDSNHAGLAQNGGGRRVLFSAHWNYLDPQGLEWLNHLGYKRVMESFDDQPYGTRFAVLGTEIRKPVNQYFDVGAHASYAVSLSGGVSNSAVGFSVGLKPAENALITLGYNFRGVKDTDFYAGNQRAHGFFVHLRLLLDERLLGLSRPAAAALSQGPRL